MNKKRFYQQIRTTLFGGKLTQGVVDTVEAILRECDNACASDWRMRAYMLATAYHESYNGKWNPDWLPVREGFAKTNAGAVQAVTKLYQNGQIETNYALPHNNGLSYYGRGWVQITWLDNYRRVGKLIGVDLANNPDLALERSVSAQILVNGMYLGWFTGKALNLYITPGLTDFTNARRTVNGTDKAASIAATADKFYAAMILL